MECYKMDQTPRFLHFQRQQDGVLTLCDAADFCQTNVSKLGRWAKLKRVCFIEHRGRRYFGVKSLREWMHFRRSYSKFQQVEKVPVWLQKGTLAEFNPDTYTRKQSGNTNRDSTA